MSRNLKILWIINSQAISGALYSRYGAVLFIFGKVARIITFIYFLYLLVSRTQTLSGYTVTQTIFFFLVFNLVDTGSQFLFRDVYRFRSRVVNGELDYYFLKPFNALARSLLGGIDILDFSVLLPLIGVTLWIIPQVTTSWLNLGIFLLLLVNALTLATAFHIFVLGLGITTTEVDHAVMIYRDVTSLGKIPIDVYRWPINLIFTTVIPVGIMMTIPAKALLGLTHPDVIVGSLFIGLAALLLSLKYWRYAVTQYASASS